jgi:hypothetical protein
MQSLFPITPVTIREVEIGELNYPISSTKTFAFLIFS